MMDFITAPLVVGFICIGIYGLFELFVRRKERLAIIEKIGDKLDVSALAGKFCLPSYNTPRFTFSSLKAGCLLTGMGLGLLTGFFLQIMVITNHSMDIERYDVNQLIGAAYGASVLLFGGLGLIIAFIIEMKTGKKNDK